MTGYKEPFERIISLVDRKKILKKALSEDKQVICRTADGSMTPFIPLRVTDDGHLEGKLVERTSSKAKTRTAILFFYCGKDRYFISTKMVKQEHLWRAYISIEFYKLNRRQSYRTAVPTNARLSFYVTKVDSQICQVMARIVEFSMGGAQIRWFGSPSLAKGSNLKGKIVWFRNKEISVNAIVKHKLKDGIVGIQFTNLDSVQINRLKLMSVELQQFVNYLNS
jgi:hypothetical protein